ncbi:hypothetical protein FWF48_01605 [Candidatus Saccharibacteria bacterium]|nr:hypothetical protein [Candidatus Saccharibacteria bacterium]
MKLNLKKFIRIVKTVLVAVLAFAIISQWHSGNFSRLYVAIVTLPAIFLFDILRIKKAEQLEIAYLAFLTLGAILGSVFGWYADFDGLDKVVHFVSGIVCVYFGLFIIKRLGIKSKSPLGIILFLIGLTALIAVSWEACEYFSNFITHGDPQNVQYSGVDDTMWDMMFAVLGASLTTLYLWRTKKLQ